MRKIFIPNLHIGFEKWKYCMALDVYISSYGRIKNTDGEIQTLCSKDNYLFYKGRPVHRLVMEMFHPVPGYANLTVDHKDHNTRNNKISNLEWVTMEENQKRAAEDNKQNSPTMNPAPIDTKAVNVKLNGVKVPAATARALMKTDKSLADNKIDSLFSKITITRTASYGNYKIEICD